METNKKLACQAKRREWDWYAKPQGFTKTSLKKITPQTPSYRIDNKCRDPHTGLRTRV